MAWPQRVIRGGVTYTLARYPARLPSAGGRLVVGIYREGRLCGAAVSQAEAIAKIESGRYDRPQEKAS